jgi:two-component system sensor histidine kinase ChiS
VSQPQILVVENSQLEAKTIAKYLTDMGYQSSVKKNLVEATDWLRTPGNMADLIISDATMSQTNGHEFIRQIRADPAAIYPLVILLAEQDDLNEKIAGFEAGADDYLVKPVDAVELNMRVRALLARTQALRPAVSPPTG